MKKWILIVLIFGAFSPVATQVLYEEISSQKLQDTRKLKIQLPRNYDANTQKTYPVILVFDADYLFEPVAGMVDLYSYWDEMPEAIVVGIMQNRTRDFDTYYGASNFPEESGAQFFEFIGMELMPYLDRTFRTAKFVMGVGQELTAQFLNYYLFKTPSLFNGFVIISPDLAPNFENLIPQRISAINQHIFYYLATGGDDLSHLKTGTLQLHEGLKQINTPHFHYHFDHFEGASHIAIAGKAIPAALQNIFSVFRPITQDDYKNVLLKLESSLYDYLVERYKIIEDLFGFKVSVRENDILAIGQAAEEKKQWNTLESLAQLARREHPNTMLHAYYLGRFFEETGNARRAVRTYQGAFNLEEVGFITYDLLLDRADNINRNN